MAIECVIILGILAFGQMGLWAIAIVFRARHIGLDRDVAKVREEVEKHAVDMQQISPLLSVGFALHATAPNNTTQRALSEGVALRRAAHHQETWEAEHDPKLRRTVDVTRDSKPTPIPVSPETRRERSEHPPQAMEASEPEVLERETPDDLTRPFSRADMPKGAPRDPKA